MSPKECYYIMPNGVSPTQSNSNTLETPRSSIFKALSIPVDTTKIQPSASVSSFRGTAKADTEFKKISSKPRGSKLSKARSDKALQITECYNLKAPFLFSNFK